MVYNPNRFLTGLSDSSDIHNNQPVCGPVVTSSPQQYVRVPSSNCGSSSGGDWIDFDEVANEDGEQTFTLGSTPIGAYILFINGLKQSKSAYTVTGAVLTLPDTLNIMTGDLISLSYVIQP